jgi:hypothetical protein
MEAAEAREMEGENQEPEEFVLRENTRVGILSKHWLIEVYGGGIKRVSCQSCPPLQKRER